MAPCRLETFVHTVQRNTVKNSKASLDAADTLRQVAPNFRVRLPDTGLCNTNYSVAHVSACPGTWAHLQLRRFGRSHLHSYCSASVVHQARHTFTVGYHMGSLNHYYLRHNSLRLLASSFSALV